MKITCAHCGKTSDKPPGAVNRARLDGLRLFCNRRCAGLGRRKPKKSKAQLVEEKRLYGLAYRAKNLAMLKAKKRAYHKRTYDPVKAAEVRKKRMPYHVEYCRRPAYKAWKRDYDKSLRAKVYGPFAEAFMLTIDLNREIKGRMTNEQIAHANLTQNKTQRRRRATSEEIARSRPRNRGRRDRHSAAHG